MSSIFSFGAPVESYKSMSVTAAGPYISTSGAASTMNAVAAWAQPSAVSKAPYHSSVAVSKEDETLWSVRDHLEAFISKSKPIGLYSSTHISSEVLKIATKNRVRVAFSKFLFEEADVPFIASTLLQKLYSIRDSHHSDIFVSSMTLVDRLDIDSKEIHFEIYEIKDTAIGYDPYIDPSTGEIVLNRLL